MKYVPSIVGAWMLAGGLLLSAPFTSFADEITTKTATSIATAEDKVGKVIYLLGQADLTYSDGRVEPLKRQMDIPEGSLITVKQRGRVRLLMVDGETKILEANSQLSIPLYQFDPAHPQDSILSSKLIKGEVTNKTGQGGHAAKSRYRMETSSAVIGVMGTEYTVRVVGRETWVSVHEGIVSVSKLGGDCLPAAIGPCSGDTTMTLSAQQRGLALVVRTDQPKPVLVPAPPPTRSQAVETPANAPAAESSSKDKSSSSSSSNSSSTSSNTNSSGSSNTANTSASAESTSTQTSTEQAPSTTKSQVTATEQTNSNTDSKQTASTVNSSADKTTASTTTTAVMSAPVTTEVVSTPITTTTTANTESKSGDILEAITPTVTANTESKTTLTPVVATETVTTTPVVVTPTVTVTTPVVTTLIVTAPVVTSAAVTTSTTATEALGSNFVTTTPVKTVTEVVNTNLVEVVKTDTIATNTASGTTPVTNTESTTPLTNDNPATTTNLPAVKWGKYDPAATNSNLVSYSEQVSDQYTKVVLPEPTGNYEIDRLKSASTALAQDKEQYSFKMGTYEANVTNTNNGEKSAATLKDGHLTVSPVKQNFSTGFTLESTPYTGTVTATGPYADKDGTLIDDGTNAATKIRGAVGVQDGTAAAAYTFTHQIDSQLSADGAINWTGE